MTWKNKSESKFPPRGCFQSTMSKIGLTNHLCFAFYRFNWNQEGYLWTHWVCVTDRTTQFSQFCSRIWRVEKSWSVVIWPKGKRFQDIVNILLIITNSNLLTLKLWNKEPLWLLNHLLIFLWPALRHLRLFLFTYKIFLLLFIVILFYCKMLLYH